MGADAATATPSTSLPADAHDHFQAASLVLRRYGLNVAAAFDPDAARDVLMARTMPREDLEYKHVVSDMGQDGAFGPRLKTSYFRGEVRVTIFEVGPSRAVMELRARPGPDGITLQILDATVPVKVALEGETFEITPGRPAERT
jgi:hypothetical protein